MSTSHDFPEPGFTNMDARDLAELAGHLARIAPDDSYTPDNGDIAMLLRAAAHLQAMDEKLARDIDGTFVQGEALAALRARSRSNILKAPRPISNADGETIIAAIEADPTRVRRIPKGVSGLPKGELIDTTKAKAPAARRGFRLEDL